LDMQPDMLIAALSTDLHLYARPWPRDELRQAAQWRLLPDPLTQSEQVVEPP
jgi:hypothetical protein